MTQVLRWMTVLAAASALAVVSAAAVAANDATSLSIGGGGTVVGDGGPGFAAFAVSGTGPATAEWQQQPASGFFAFAGKTRHDGAPASVVVTIDRPDSITPLCGTVGPKSYPTVTFNSAADGAQLLILDADQQVLVAEAVYAKVYVYVIDAQRSFVTVNTDYGSLGFTMWADGRLIGDIALHGITDLGCG